jgi:putative SOS response-associated peptidase YedK
MCGRFALGLEVSILDILPSSTTSVLQHSQIQAMEGYPGVVVAEWIDQDQFVPRYNIAPHSQAPVLRRRERVSTDTTATTEDTPEYILHTMKWGVVPHWRKSEDKNLNTINARGENVIAGVGMWGNLRVNNRCIVLAQG